MIENNESLERSSTTLHAKEMLDDDGRPARAGTVWTTSSHIITAVIGSGVLSLAWSIAQLGWLFGPIVMLFFSLVTLYTSYFLAYCYRAGDPITGKRSYTYMEAIDNILGGKSVVFCGIMQYANLYGTAIGYTIGAAISMMAITKTDCIYLSEGKNPCPVSGNPYIIAFGIIQLGFSQIPDFHNISWLSLLAAVMSLGYSLIGLILGIVKIADNGYVLGDMGGAQGEAPIDKVWGIFQALGNIAFAYSYSNILIEIQYSAMCHEWFNLCKPFGSAASGLFGTTQIKFLSMLVKIGYLTRAFLIQFPNTGHVAQVANMGQHVAYYVPRHLQTRVRLRSAQDEPNTGHPPHVMLLLKNAATRSVLYNNSPN
ncbi:Amino acid permease 3 [Stylosanthes scabra]|uniref:Amino acid permease 3 n=1 Tax=Stylosanthes scabra TaxID=79078 RepID=A0ABU6TMI3_9FABA|nr:Amino acid permease 3 [Stylosanthes scabra]